MSYCMKCGKPTDNGMMCEDCVVSGSPWLSAMKIKENDLEQENAKLRSENAELRARIENTVELKARIGDILYMPWVYDGVYDVAKLKICAIFIEGNTITYLTDLTDDLGKRGFCRRYKYGNFEAKDFGTLVFKGRAEAEAKLAKLRGTDEQV